MARVKRDAYDPWGKRRFAKGNEDATGNIVSQTIRGFNGQPMVASQAGKEPCRPAIVTPSEPR